MFTEDFYPTPEDIITEMVSGYDLRDKIILEPSAGKGNIVDYLLSEGAQVIACEKHPDLRTILNTKCNVIGEDFLKIQSEQVSHIDLIFMNPPFRDGAEHILKAFQVAPAGCKIVALCNLQTIDNPCYAIREQLVEIISQHGQYSDLGRCFQDSERLTDVRVAMVQLVKPAESNSVEFDGFFMEEEIEEKGEYGIMRYNLVRDIVNRYINSVKIFDRQIEMAVEMNNLTNGFFECSIGLNITHAQAPLTRNEFKKQMQKAGWMWIFDKMDMQKYATKGLREDINKFVEKQQSVPFTMKNIYRMLDIVIGTQGQRMDRALIEVFDKLTMHYDENRYCLEGWKSNSYYLINQKFIMPHVVEANFSGGIRTNFYGWAEPIEDMLKALCYLTGDDYSKKLGFRDFLHNNKCKFGEKYVWEYFTFRAYRKGTVHFTFNDTRLWEQFNQRVAKVKGYPLFEHKAA